MATYTTYSHDSTLITPPSTSSSNCVTHQNDSDCGSSSGFGGMKNQEISDEAASSSSSHRPQTRPGSLQSASMAVQRQPPPPPPLIPLPQQHAVPPSIYSNQIIHHHHHSVPPPQLHTIPHHQLLTPSPMSCPPIPYNRYGPPPPAPPMGMYNVPPPSIPPTPNVGPSIPPWMGNVQPGPNNSIFVHIQQGDTLVLYNETEPQHIQGPASIKMISDSSHTNLPLPINVPPGHQCHQFIDELGILRHVVLSLEPPNSRTQYPREMNVPQLVGPAQPSSSQQIPLPPPSIASSSHSQITYMGPQNGLLTSYHNNNNNIGRKWIPRLPITQESFYPEVEPDREENDRMRKMLNCVVSPTVERILATEVDIKWQQLDTSEAGGLGAEFPSIDASEFTYFATIFEHTGRLVSTYVCEPNANNIMRIGNLRPHTEYSVQIKASLEERGLYGDPSKHLFFRTAPGRPEAPLMPRLVSRATDSVHITWREAVNNGAAVNLYNVYIETMGEEGNATVLQFGGTEAKITRLLPSTSYMFRITSINALGESFDATPIEVTTRPEGYPLVPLPPAITSVQHRSVRLNWLPIPQCTYGIELNDLNKGTINVIRDRLTGCAITIGDLTPNSEYHFRLIAKHQDGDITRSEWISVRTQQQRYQNNYSQPPPSVVHDIPPRIPNNPVFIRFVNKKTEMGWKTYGQTTRDNIYNLEGSSINQPNEFRSIYRGPAQTCVITDEDIHYVRVQAISKRGIASEFSKKSVVPRPDVSRPEKPEKLPAPELSIVSKGKVRVTWNRISNKLRPKSVVTYLLQEIDANGDQTPIYSGSDDEHIMENVPSETKITVRIRPMIMLNDTTVSGDWSESKTIMTPRDLPTSPYDVQFISENNMLLWNCDDKSTDLLFFIEVVDCSTDDVTKYETREKSLHLKSLDYAEKYSISVRSSHGGGDCEDVQTIEIETPADVPSQPEAVTVAAESLHTLTVRWTAADSHGSQIISYRLTIMQDKTFIKEAVVVGYENEYILTELKPSTVYKVEIIAENSIGTGPSVMISGRTKELPPVPPVLECEPEATSMRLRWKENTEIPVIYKLIRLRKEQQIQIYEGDQLTARVKNLSQDTEYTFLMRVSNKITGTSVLSDPVTFRTLLAPPPTVRSAPTATRSTTMVGYHHVEWSNVLPKEVVSVRQFYRLQLAAGDSNDERWHSVYEGASPSFNLKSSDYKCALHLRVFCVRKDTDVDTVSQPSPVTYILNEQIEICPEEDEENTELMTLYEKIRYNLDYTKFPFTFTLFLFFGLLFTLALCDYLYNITENAGPPTPMMTVSHTQTTHTPSPPQPSGHAGLHGSATHREL